MMPVLVGMEVAGRVRGVRLVTFAVAGSRGRVLVVDGFFIEAELAVLGLFGVLCVGTIEQVSFSFRGWGSTWLFGAMVLVTVA